MSIDAQFKQCKKQIKALKQEIRNILSQRNEHILAKVNAEQTERKYAENESSSKRKIDANFFLQKRLSGHCGKIYALKWSKDSRSIVSASQDGSIIIWDMAKYAKRLAIPLKMAWVMTCDYSPDGHLVASGGLDNMCSIFNIKDRSGYASDTVPHRQLQQHEGYVSCCRFTDDGHILTASGDSRIILWDIDYQTPIACYSGHCGDVESVAHNESTQNQFISGSIDMSAKLYVVLQCVCD